MFSLPTMPPPRPRALRRGGPLLFRTLWPDVRAALVDASLPGGSQAAETEAAPPGPAPAPWASAA